MRTGCRKVIRQPVLFRTASGETLRSGNTANETKTAAAGNRNRTKASPRLPNILPDIIAIYYYIS